MTSGNSFLVRKATISDLDAIKRLADKHRTELGFVLRPSLEKSIHNQEIIVATSNEVLIGFVHYRHRRDEQTTLYHIAVGEEFRLHGIGEKLISNLWTEAQSLGKERILLKCPVPLPANRFYAKVGFKLERTEVGKERELNVWQYEL